MVSLTLQHHLFPAGVAHAKAERPFINGRQVVQLHPSASGGPGAQEGVCPSYSDGQDEPEHDQASVPQVVRKGSPSWLTSTSRSRSAHSSSPVSRSSAPGGGGREVQGQGSWRAGDRGSHSRRSASPQANCLSLSRLPGRLSQRRGDHAGLSQGHRPAPVIHSA